MSLFGALPGLAFRAWIDSSRAERRHWWRQFADERSSRTRSQSLSTGAFWLVRAMALKRSNQAGHSRWARCCFYIDLSALMRIAATRCRIPDARLLEHYIPARSNVIERVAGVEFAGACLRQLFQDEGRILSQPGMGWRPRLRSADCSADGTRKRFPARRVLWQPPTYAAARRTSTRRRQ